VYAGHVSSTVTLDDFTWFYWSAPLQNISLHLDSDFSLLTAPDGLAWFGSHIGHPEALMNELGLFVYRTGVKMNTGIKERVEVIRTCKPLHMFGSSIPNDMAMGTSWFFNVIGSGIFLERRTLLLGEHLMVKNRPVLILNNNSIVTIPLGRGMSQKPDVDWSFLYENNISMLIMTEAFGYRVVPRREVVIRFDLKQFGCCSYPTFSTGYTERLPCYCENRAGFIGCENRELPNLSSY